MADSKPIDSENTVPSISSSDSNNINPSPTTTEAQVDSSATTANDGEHKNTNKENAPNTENEGTLAGKAGADLEHADILSPRNPSSRKPSPREENTTALELIKEQASKKEHDDEKDDKTKAQKTIESSHDKQLEKEMPKTRQRSHSHSSKSEKRKSDKREKHDKHDKHDKEKREKHNKYGKNERNERNERNENEKNEKGEKHEENEEHEKDEDREKIEKYKKPTVKSGAKDIKKDGTNDASQHNGAPSRNVDSSATNSPEINTTPGKRDKRLTINELAIPLEATSSRVYVASSLTVFIQLTSLQEPYNGQ
jgi:hypothetical protein